ncbi:hypothetical protein D3C78_693070 [compost metagenome]
MQALPPMDRCETTRSLGRIVSFLHRQGVSYDHVDRHSPDRLHQRAVRLSRQTRPLSAGGCPHHGSPRQAGSHHQGVAGAGRQSGGHRHRRGKAAAIQGAVSPAENRTTLPLATLWEELIQSLELAFSGQLLLVSIDNGLLPRAFSHPAEKVEETHYNLPPFWHKYRP